MVVSSGRKLSLCLAASLALHAGAVAGLLALGQMRSAPAKDPGAPVTRVRLVDWAGTRGGGSAPTATRAVPARAASVDRTAALPPAANGEMSATNPVPVAVAADLDAAIVDASVASAEALVSPVGDGQGGAGVGGGSGQGEGGGASDGSGDATGSGGSGADADELRRCWQGVGTELQRRADAEMPRALKRRAMVGEVVLRFLLDARGVAGDVRIESVKGSPLLGDAARQLLARPFASPCPGEGRWALTFDPPTSARAP